MGAVTLIIESNHMALCHAMAWLLREPWPEILFEDTNPDDMDLGLKLGISCFFAWLSNKILQSSECRVQKLCSISSTTCLSS